MSSALTLSAPAKLNLYLHITGRRQDGYHLLDSLVAFTTLADQVELSDDVAYQISASGPFADALGTGDDNLALKAARALGERSGMARFARINLVKNIPVAAGLGGGSADAAAVLYGLRQAWRLDRAPLGEIGAAIGADVPVCLESQPAFMKGVGDVLGPKVTLPEAGLLLVNPGVMLGTGAVFSAYDQALAAGPGEGGGEAGGKADREADREEVRPRPALDPAPADAAALARVLAGTGNDLTKAALGLAPEIGTLLESIAIADGCRLARMAGSGPTCFGLFDDEAAADAAAREIGRAAPQYWCWAGGLRAGRA